MKQNFWILLIILACSAVACKSGQKKDGNMEKETVLKIETSMGDIKVKLYNELRNIEIISLNWLKTEHIMERCFIVS